MDTKRARALSAKQEAIYREWIVDMNATAAARRAGYSERTANEQAARLMKNRAVPARIVELQAEGAA